MNRLEQRLDHKEFFLEKNAIDYFTNVYEQARAKNRHEEERRGEKRSSLLDPSGTVDPDKFLFDRPKNWFETKMLVEK
jgi:hypothetical protein